MSTSGEMHVDTRPPSNRAADNLFRIFEDMINSGELRDGDPLPPEREIVKSYGVSRTVVREAVLALANKGLIDARPRHRPVVRKPDYDTALRTIESVVGRLLNEPDGIRNLFETRIVVEAALVRSAAKDAHPGHLAQLRKALQDNGDAIENSQRFYQTDVAFHRVLFEISGNPVLTAVHQAFTDWLAPQWAQMPRLPDRNRQNFSAHSRICEAIERGDPDEAETALREHLADAWTQVEHTFQDL